MNRVTILRTETDDCGTFGLLTTPSGFQCYTMELPWRDLDKNGIGDKEKSCITAGTYKAIWAQSPTRKDAKGDPEWTYRLQAVAGRDGILIHPANWAGDVTKGMKAQVLGCIALGRAIGELAGQKALLSSRNAVEAFVADMDKEPFELTISWADGIAPKEVV